MRFPGLSLGKRQPAVGVRAQMDFLKHPGGLRLPHHTNRWQKVCCTGFVRTSLLWSSAVATLGRDRAPQPGGAGHCPFQRVWRLSLSDG
jgi:hypothetical protein